MTSIGHSKHNFYQKHVHDCMITSQYFSIKSYNQDLKLKSPTRNMDYHRILYIILIRPYIWQKAGGISYNKLAIQACCRVLRYPKDYKPFLDAILNWQNKLVAWY